MLELNPLGPDQSQSSASLPVSLSWMSCPGQAVKSLDVALAKGAGAIMISTEALEVQPSKSVTVTKYSPILSTVELGMVGNCPVPVQPLGPVQS